MDVTQDRDERVQGLARAIERLGDPEGKPVMLMVRYTDGGVAAIAPDVLARALINNLDAEAGE